MDFLSAWAAGIVGLLPALPATFNNALSSITAAGTSIGGMLAKTGVLIPWNEFTIVVQWWLGALAFWALLLPIRLVLWLVGK
jgi:hypothetical protein